MKEVTQTQSLWAKYVSNDEPSTSAASYQDPDDGDGPDRPICCWNLCPNVGAVKAPRPLVQGLMAHPAIIPPVP